jgi:acetylornithine deacetylase
VTAHRGPPLEIDAAFVTATLRDLVRINSINPSLAPDGGGEREIADYLTRVLAGIGLRVSVHEALPGRPSVVAVLPGSGHGQSLMLNAHIDTVGVEGMREPFSGEIRDGRLYGRGSYDMKGSVAACVAAAKALADARLRLPGDLLVALVADEEYASIGTAEVLTRYHPDGAIVTEPSALQICVAHKGFTWFQIETVGRAYHGSQFQHGVDANMRMGRVLSELDTLERALRVRPPHVYVGPPSLHAATIQGGTGVSTYAANCTLRVERRTVPGESADMVAGEIHAIIDRLVRADPTFEASVRTLLTRDPFEVSADASIVKALTAAATAVIGAPPKVIGENPWMDAALLAAAGVETVVFGPGGDGAHSDTEWVDLGTVLQLSDVLARTAMAYCSGRGPTP